MVLLAILLLTSRSAESDWKLESDFSELSSSYYCPASPQGSPPYMSPLFVILFIKAGVSGSELLMRRGEAID